MTDNRMGAPLPKVKGEGSVMYRCAKDGKPVDPEDAIFKDDRTYCSEHDPWEGHDRDGD